MEKYVSQRLLEAIGQMQGFHLNQTKQNNKKKNQTNNLTIQLLLNYFSSLLKCDFF